MSSFPQCRELESATTVRPLQNTLKSNQQVLIMSQNPSSLQPKVDYSKRFSKKFMLALSFLQLLSAALAISTQMILLSTDKPGGAGFVATGIWCGIIYGLSGFFGVLASLRPSKSTIVTFMVMTIFASIFSFPGFLIPSLLMPSPSRFISSRGVGHGMIVMQIVISLVQAGVAIASSVMTCKAVCHCCRPMREVRAVNYTYNPGNSLTNMGMVNQPNVLPQQQPGYVTIPMSQLQAPGGSMTLPTVPTAPEASVRDTVHSSAPGTSAPPKYVKRC